MRGELWALRREAAAAHAACRAGLDCRYGAGHREERTENIWIMLVTLEVSKLSGWLNADAYCGGSKEEGTYTMRPGRRETVGDRGANTVQATADWGQGTAGEERTLNM